MFDLGKVLLKEKDDNIIANFDPVGKELSSIAYESVYDDVFQQELKNISDKYKIDEYFLREKLNSFFKSKFDLNLTLQEIEQLSVRYKLGIASNFISDIYRSLEPIHKFMSLVLISGALGLEKPSYEFFYRLKSEAYYLGVLPNEILFIDDKNENLLTAKQLGINAMQYNNSEETESSLYNCIVRFISDLETKEEEIVRDNSRLNSVLNKKANRNTAVLKRKLENQNSALYNQLEFATVGALPVLDTYGYKPTGDTKLPFTNEDLESEDYVFSEALLKTLTDIQVPFSKDDLYPVYILLSFGSTAMGNIIKKVTHEPYSHASLAFDPSLSKLYSFNIPGLVIEDIKEGNYIKKKNYKFSLYTIFVNRKQLFSMDSALKGFLDKKDELSYSIKGLLHKLFNKETHDDDKFFCSQFVAEIIKAGDEKLIKKDASLYTPYDLRKIKSCFFIQKGYLANYSKQKTVNRVELIKKRLLENKNYSEGVLHNYIKKGANSSLILRYKRMNYKEEYNKSHRLLKIYAETEDIESIKEELAKLWSYYLIIEELYIQKAKENPELKNTKAYKDAVIAKAFILGDIREYLIFIKQHEPNFNFGKYYEESKYNKDALIITQEDIKDLINLLNKII
jgi:FMN phosphatase YigB (HAD superfamily)